MAKDFRSIRETRNDLRRDEQARSEQALVEIDQTRQNLVNASKRGAGPDELDSLSTQFQQQLEAVKVALFEQIDERHRQIEERHQKLADDLTQLEQLIISTAQSDMDTIAQAQRKEAAEHREQILAMIRELKAD